MSNRIDIDYVKARTHYLYRDWLYNSGNPLPSDSTGDVVVVECNRYGFKAVMSSDVNSYLIGKDNTYLGEVSLDTTDSQIPNAVADIWLSGMFG